MPPQPSAPPVQTSSLPEPTPPPPSAPPVPAYSAPPPIPPQPSAPPSAYAAPADVPLDPSTPPVRMVNNQPVVSQGFYGTQAPPPVPPAPPPSASAILDPAQRVMAAPPPAPSNPVAAVQPSPVDVARGQNVAMRPTEPPAELPPPAPRDIAPIPAAPSATPSYAAPVSPPAAPYVASLPPASLPPAGTPPDRLDEALRQTFPDTSASRRRGLDALTATIYFADGSANLTEDDRSILREVGRLYRERGGDVRVVGYASADGRSADLVARQLANLDIAVRRADAVSRELARAGVPAGVITTSAEGAPAGPGTAGGGFGPAGERRVDIYLDY
ncbi:MAG: OmpA family protein [Pseudomonadota bacterium]